MAKMKIRGGDLDLVEYEFQPFLPGECIHTLGFEGEYKLTPHGGSVRSRSPPLIFILANSIYLPSYAVRSK